MRRQVAKQQTSTKLRHLIVIYFSALLSHLDKHKERDIYSKALKFLVDQIIKSKNKREELLVNLTKYALH